MFTRTVVFGGENQSIGRDRLMGEETGGKREGFSWDWWEEQPEGEMIR